MSLEDSWYPLSGRKQSGTGSDAVEQSESTQEREPGWRPSSVVDEVFVRLSNAVEPRWRAVALMSVGVLLLAGVSVGVASLVLNPVTLALTAVSVVPAVFVAVYVRESNPDSLAFATLASSFLLGFVAVAFAYLLNESAVEGITGFHAFGATLFVAAFVAPVEEALKMTAVYVNGDGGDTVFDYVVVGAFVGLGFAAGENAVYVTTDGLLGGGLVETVVGRAGVAPAHVAWSSIAGFYLGVARSNPRYSGALVLKGLFVAALLHGGYNLGITHLPAAVEASSSSGGTKAQLATLFYLIGFYAVLYGGLELIIRRLRSRGSRKSVARRRRTE